MPSPETPFGSLIRRDCRLLYVDSVEVRLAAIRAEVDLLIALVDLLKAPGDLPVGNLNPALLSSMSRSARELKRLCR